MAPDQDSKNTDCIIIVVHFFNGQPEENKAAL